MADSPFWVAIKGEMYDFLDGEDKGLRFTLVERVGSGNAGEVWSVNASDGSSMALKVFKTPLISEAKGVKEKKRQEMARKQFETEASFSTDLPWFVPPSSNGRITKDDGRSAIAFPLLDPSEDLDSFISAREGGDGPDLSQRLEISIEVLKGIIGLHAEDWLHNDIKAKNILYCPGESIPIRIIDMQFAVKQKDINERYGKQKSHLGTMGYIAPEIYASGASAMSISSDIWSLGCTIYHIITGLELHDRDPDVGPVDQKGRKEFVDRCMADMDEPIRSRERLLDEGIPGPICEPLSRMLTPKQSFRTNDLTNDVLVAMQKFIGVHDETCPVPDELETDFDVHPPLVDSEVIRVMVRPIGKPRQYIMCRKGETKYVISHHFDGEKFDNRKLMSMKWDGEGLVCSGRPYVTIDGEPFRNRSMGHDTMVVFKGLTTRIICQSTNP